MSDENKQSSPVRTIILFVVIVPIVGYLFNFAIKKNNESEERAMACQVQCADDGYLGHSFKWSVFSGPQCSCFGEE